MVFKIPERTQEFLEEEEDNHFFIFTKHWTWIADEH